LGLAVLSSILIVRAANAAPPTVAPTTFDFGDVEVGTTSAAQSFTLTRDTTNVTIVDVTIDDSTNFTLTPPAGLPVDLNGAGASTSFSVTCNPATAGAHSANVTVTYNDGADADLPDITLDCNGVTAPDITVSNNSLSFGNVGVGGGAETRTFTIDNSGDQDLTVTGFSFTGDAGFSIVSPATPFTITSSDPAVTVTVAFDPATNGAKSATLAIASNDPDENPYDVSLSGTGVDVLDVSPLTLSFADTPVGLETAAQSISICNRGNNALTIDSVALSGAAFVTVTNVTDGTVLANTDDCATYSVKFAPQTAATFAGTVTVTMLSPVVPAPSPQAKAVSLSGKGLSVAYTFTPSPVAFGDIDINAPTQTINVVFRNTGDSVLRVNTATVTNSVSTAFTRGTVSPSLAVIRSNNETVTIPIQANTSEIGAAVGNLQVNYDVCRTTAPATCNRNLNANVALTASGTSVDVALGATAIDFGLYDVDLPAKDEVVTITNNGTAPLSITGLSITNDAAGVFSVVSPSASVGTPYVVSASGGSVDVHVAYKPTTENAGEPTATLVIATQNNGNINITLDGQGADRRISVAPTLVFPDTFRSPASPTVGYVDVANTGRAPLNISMALIQADDEGVFAVRTPSFTQVGPLSTETVEVEFNPTMLQADPYTAQLVIMNDDDNAPMALIDLSGLVILPNIAVDPGVIDYGRVGVGVTSEVGLEVPIVDIVNLDSERSFQLRELRVVDLAGQPVDPKLFRVRGLEDPRTVDADGRIGLEVEFNPTREGRFEFQLQVFAEADPLPITTAPIRAEAVDVKLRGGGCQAGGDNRSLAGLLMVLGALAWARRRRVLARVAATVALLWLAAPGTASAQATRNLELGTFRPTIGAEADFMSVDNTRVGQHLAWTLGFGLNHAVKPLIVESNETDMTDSPVSQRTVTDLYGTFAFLGRFEVGVRLPLMSQSGDAPQFSSIQPADGFAVGDVNLEGKVHLVSAKPLSLAAGVFGSIPTATDQEFAGAAGFSGGAEVIAGLDLGRIRVAANLGYRMRESGRLADVVQGDEVRYAVATSYLFRDELQLIGEIVGALGLEGDETGGISPIEALAGARYHVTPSWGIVAGVGRGIVSGIGAPAFRGLLSLSFSPGRSTRRIADVVGKTIMVSSLEPGGDLDEDGILNKDDKCPQQKEDVDQFEDDDGCPDFDNDGDGLADSVDRCINVAEDKDGHLDDDGCPDEDNDGDGIPDIHDQCPNEPEDQDGFADEDGCDDFDNDHDGVPDLMDACPKQQEVINGIDDEDGCPDRGESAVMILNNQISVLEPISFTGTTAKLDKRSQNVLAQVGATLRAYPELALVAVEVHVHPRGKDDQQLSEERAVVVRDWLVKHGVKNSRLKMQALGSSQPVSKKGRSAARFNDRVLFKVLKADKRRP